MKKIIIGIASLCSVALFHTNIYAPAQKPSTTGGISSAAIVVQETAHKDLIANKKSELNALSDCLSSYVAQAMKERVKSIEKFENKIGNKISELQDAINRALDGLDDAAEMKK